MGDNGSYAALTMVAPEVRDALNDARQALEAYVEDSNDSSRIRFCLSLIHQVLGSLKMVEFHGAILFAEEMESLTKAIIDGSVANTEEAQEVLMRSLLQLPLYLDHVMDQHEDHPGIVLPLLNDMRATRKQNYLSETNLFSPDMSSLDSRSGTPHPMVAEPAKFSEVVSKLREMYQYSAASVLRGLKIDEYLSYMDKALIRLESITRGTAQHPLWQAASAFVDCLARDEIELSVAVKSLLRAVAKELRELEDQGPKALDQAPDEKLLRNLLYYIARSENWNSKVELLDERYRLKHSILDGALEGMGFNRSMISSPDASAIRAVVAALNEEVNTVKQVLSHLLADQGSASDLEGVLPVFKRISDTLALLGINDLREDALSQLVEMKKLAEAQDLSKDSLERIAHGVAAIEHRLDAMDKGAESIRDFGNIDERQIEIDTAMTKVLEECREGLTKLREQVSEYHNGGGELEHLMGIPRQLADIRGGLNIVGLPRLSAIISASERFVIEKFLKADIDPESEFLASFASVVEATDYYLERLIGGHEENLERYLEIAENTLREVGFQSEGESLPATSTPGEAPDTPANESLSAEFYNEIVAQTENKVQSSDDELDQLDLSAEAPETSEQIEELSQSIEAPANASVLDAASIAGFQEMFAKLQDPPNEESDEEIVEIFIEEAGEVLATIKQQLPLWSSNLQDAESLANLRRAFHTLKGSGRMVQAMAIGELAWSVENMLNRVVDGSVQAHPSQAELLHLVSDLVPELVSAFENKQPAPQKPKIASFMAWADAMSRGEIPELDLAAIPVVDVDVGVEPDTEVVAPTGTAEGADLESTVAEISLVDTPDEEEDEDRVLLELFASEARTHLSAVKEFVDHQVANDPIFQPPSDPLQKALHTLKGSAYMANVENVAQLVTPLELFIKEMRIYQLKVDQEVLQLLQDGSAYIEEALKHIDAGEFPAVSELDNYVARCHEIYEQRIAHLSSTADSDAKDQTGSADPAMLANLMAKEMHLLLDADQIIEQWRLEPGKPAKVSELANELAALADGAGRAQHPPLAAISAQLRDIHRHIDSGIIKLDDTVFGALLPAHELLIDMADCVAADQDLPVISDALKSELDALANAPQRSLETVESTPDQPELNVPEAPLFEAPIIDVPAEQPVEHVPTGVMLDGPAISLDGPVVVDGEIEADILEVFLDEASELAEELDVAIHDWEGDWENSQAKDAMLRALHTLKGGARLAGLTAIGELTHAYEAVLENCAGPRAADNFFDVIHQYQDQVHIGVRNVKSMGLDTAADESATPETSTTEKIVSITQANTQARAASSTEISTNFEMPPPPVEQQKSQVSASNNQRGGSTEVVKINAELLEELVNLAGETSISRGRLEQQVSDFGSAITEMDKTLRRLNEQIRRLDIETEAQILFRQEQMGENDSFDPLEFDRYSQLQQLSRSLSESASDLVDLKTTLGDKVKDTESLLIQQQRINSSLQEGLMRARMVPFSRLVPRLRRIVRQIGSELGRQVNFELDNVEGEMDRSVLEHMVAPLEHMLRNAVDHGIESPEDRLAAGKPETGRILLSFAREGGDILLRLADDGRGIELDKVRRKAIERGLMAEGAELSDHDIMQFILQAGFSTRESVTQISGRGVGMDVVAAEIKQLGGSMSIESREGVGTQFTVRLPFTVSVNRALMVTIGAEQYAIPLNSIEGIVRVSPFELEHYYSEEEARFEYAGEEYRVRYLGNMLYEDNHPRLEGHTMPLPVILVRSAQHTMAIQVDALQGSREIVVKSLGAQFAAVQGLSGATVMGDGSVVVILDPHALVRRSVAVGGLAISMQPQQLAAPEQVIQAPKTVMVVDDSVTVRKVTSRFLEREGYNVFTASDGVDALQRLQDRVPDIMLLDIEMPRMDGFELAKNIRTTEQWMDIPIIMITSRTGDKHRDHAFSIGVNRYLGKPYQEEVLMEQIQELIGEDEK